MRENLFRGKNDGKWYHGSLIQNPFGNRSYIDTCEFKTDESGAFYIQNFRVEVAPETVGEWIGIPDKNGKAIYVGDIVKWIYKRSLQGRLCHIGRIMWEERSCRFCLYEEKYDIAWVMSDYHKEGYEIIGNIFDNPELLKGVTE